MADFLAQILTNQLSVVCKIDSFFYCSLTTPQMARNQYLQRRELSIHKLRAASKSNLDPLCDGLLTMMSVDRLVCGNWLSLHRVYLSVGLLPLAESLEAPQWPTVLQCANELLLPTDWLAPELQPLCSKLADALKASLVCFGDAQLELDTNPCQPLSERVQQTNAFCATVT